jgi:predicted  nucleic acid-binding Zn-ribbon protein
MVGPATLNYSSIEKAMNEAINKMEELTQNFAVLADELGVAEATFKAEFAKERIAARVEGYHDGVKVTGDFADDIATAATRELRFMYEAAKAKHDACRQALMTIRTQMEGFRSLMASHRESGA